jgi:hypothetical protein
MKKTDVVNFEITMKIGPVKREVAEQFIRDLAKENKITEVKATGQFGRKTKKKMRSGGAQADHIEQ